MEDRAGQKFVIYYLYYHAFFPGMRSAVQFCPHLPKESGLLSVA